MSDSSDATNNGAPSRSISCTVIVPARHGAVRGNERQHAAPDVFNFFSHKGSCRAAGVSAARFCMVVVVIVIAWLASDCGLMLGPCAPLHGAFRLHGKTKCINTQAVLPVGVIAQQVLVR